MDKTFNLLSSHFRVCLSELVDGESGFLKNEQMPMINVEEFRMKLRIMGIQEKAPKPQASHDIFEPLDPLLLQEQPVHLEKAGDNDAQDAVVNTVFEFM